MTKIEMKFLPQQPLKCTKCELQNFICFRSKTVGSHSKAGNNTFLLRNQDVFLDMLTDSGVNAMSDQQLASMMIADDAYAGSATYYKLEEKVTSLFGLPFLPAHQGRARTHYRQNFGQTGNAGADELPFHHHQIAYCFARGEVDELVIDEGLKLQSTHPFKGNMDIEKLKKYFAQYPKEKLHSCAWKQEPI